MVLLNSVFEANQRSFKFTCLTGLAFCLAGLLLSAGCSKGLVGRTPDVSKIWICDEEADNALQRQDYEAGILLHQQFLEKKPRNGLALYHLGYAYGQTGEHLKEVSYYEKAIRCGFQEDRIFFNLGMAYGELNEGKKSVRAFKKALEINPDNADNHFGLAVAYQRNCNDKLAEEEFLRVIKIDPNHLDALLYLSMLYADLGELQRARELLRKILEVDPSHRTARQFLESVEKE